MLVKSWLLEPWLQYGQVHLEPSPWAGEPDTAGVDDNVEMVDRAFKTRIAQGRYLTVFITPHRDVFPLPLLGELRDSRPDDDMASWPEAFEATVVADVDGMLWSSPTMDGVFIPVPAGTYQVLIAGRGFADTDHDLAAALDNYRPLAVAVRPAGTAPPTQRLAIRPVRRPLGASIASTIVTRLIRRGEVCRAAGSSQMRV